MVSSNSNLQIKPIALVNQSLGLFGDGSYDDSRGQANASAHILNKNYGGRDNSNEGTVTGNSNWNVMSN